VVNLAVGCEMLPHPASTGRYVDVEELYASCKVPGNCEMPLSCEGTYALVKGRIDFRNVFDRSRFPSLPYEKFTLLDTYGNKTVEVWAISGQNEALFDKLYLQRNLPAGPAYVRGKIAGVDMPTTKACSRGIKLEILFPEDIFFETKN
jgi:hypothetical protein